MPWWHCQGQSYLRNVRLRESVIAGKPFPKYAPLKSKHLLSLGENPWLLHFVWRNKHILITIHQRAEFSLLPADVGY